MVKKAIFAKLEAKPGKEKDVETLLKKGLEIVQAEEPDTVTWYALKLGPSTYGIFDTFTDDAGRQAHLNGKVAAALMEEAPNLLAKAPQIDMVEVIVSK